MFKYSTNHINSIDDVVKPESWKTKLILSIDDEELPMVNIIKTKTINLLSDE